MVDDSCLVPVIVIGTAPPQTSLNPFLQPSQTGAQGLSIRLFTSLPVPSVCAHPPVCMVDCQFRLVSGGQ